MARGVDTPGARPGNLTMDVIYRDGRRIAKGTVHNMSFSLAGPPTHLLGQHMLWNDSDFPSFDSPSTVNAMVSCGVRGDGITDDEPLLSACLRAHRDVFLPKGYYRLGRTLELAPHNRLVGLSQTHSVLMPVSTGFGSGENESVSARPVIRTAAGAPTTLAFIGINSWWHSPGVFTLDWRSQGGLWRSNYEESTRVCERG
eukprot:SAG31_NODE_3905_length_3765_cov_6.684670_2_plen_200_part_00